jgi:periplasmic protein TonB
MLFRRIFESRPRTAVIMTVEGYVVSIIMHSVLIAVTLVATSEMPKRTDLAEHFTPVEYFIPKDRSPGVQARQERITFAALPAPSGEGQAETPSDQRIPLKVVREEGKANQEIAAASAPPAQAPQILGDSVMTVLEVDTAAARYEDSAAPPYPASLLEKRIEGTVAVQYVVDTTGLADTTSFLVLSSTHPLFSASVRAALPAMRFRPAVMNTRKVRQLVQQLFSFRIDTTLLAQQKKPPKG